MVYLARDVQLDRDVAIKVLPAHLARDPEARGRFVREARTAAGLSHPNIVPIHRVGEVPAGRPSAVRQAPMPSRASTTRSAAVCAEIPSRSACRNTSTDESKIDFTAASVSASVQPASTRHR